MSEKRTPTPEHALTSHQRDLADFDAQLETPATDTALVPAGGGEMIPIDDDVLFPEPIVGQLFEFAQHPERHTEAELQAAVDKAELLLQKLELRAKMAAPKTLPKITWIVGVFIPEIRKQLAEHYRRTQQAAQLVDQQKTIAEALNPILQKLKQQVLNLNAGDNLPSAQTTEIEKQERRKLLEREWEKIENLATDQFLENPILIIYIPHPNIKIAQNALKDSRLSNFIYKANGDTNTRYIFHEYVKELNQSLRHADIRVLYETKEFGNVENKYDYSGHSFYKYYDIQSLVVKIKVAIAKYKEVLDASRVE